MGVRSLYSAASGMQAQQQGIDVIANNLANVNTFGFKKMRPVFEDVYYQELRDVGATSDNTYKVPSGIQVGLGSRTVATQTIFTQGSPLPTERELDVAIEGRGFFKVVLPDGTEAYTRDGSFNLNDQGMLVNNNGYQVDGGFTFPQDYETINISTDGFVEYTQGGQTNRLGQLQLFTFVNPGGLKAIGSNLFVETPSSGAESAGNPTDVGFGGLQQRYIESSNVELVKELIGLITGQRAYEVNSRVVQTADEMLQTTANLRR